VEVHGGPYLYNTGGQTALTANGTAQRPVFIRGIDDGKGAPWIQGPGTVAQGYGDRSFVVDGSYYIIEGLRFGNGTTLLVVLAGDHGVLRNCEIANVQPPGNGAGISLGLLAHNHVIYNNHSHHNGNYLSLVDSKVHGLAFAEGRSYIWILNNEFDHNGGQSMQIGADDIPDDSAWPHHIYVGFNRMHEDRESSVALKQARDVIVSQNWAGPYFPNPVGSTGAASPVTMSPGRFGPHRAWTIFNRVEGNLTGFRANGNAPNPPHPIVSDIYVIGNLIINTHSAQNNPSDPYQPGAAMLGWDNIRLYFVDNTIVDADKGVSFTSAGYYEVTGNLLNRVGDPMAFVPANWGTNKYDYNFYEGSARLAYGSTTPILSLAQVQAFGQEIHSKQGASLIDATYKPTSGSSAIGANVRSSVYDTFFTLYGIDIAKDYTGAPRPRGAWTIGAYEFAPGTGAAPAGPSGLVVR
jgi:hypothetical protein